LLQIKEDAKARLGEAGEGGFLLSYLVAGFEGEIRPV
jgi:hypothetical protein